MPQRPLKVEVGEEVVRAKPLKLPEYPGDSEERPVHQKDPQPVARDNLEDMAGSGKPVELAFRERIERVLGPQRYHEKGEGKDKVIFVHHQNGDGSVAVWHLIDCVNRGTFDTFCERFARNLLR